MNPLVLYPLQCDFEIPDDLSSYFNYTGSSSGWMNAMIFESWLFNSLINHISYNRVYINAEMQPVLLILDNHSSREAIDVDMLWNTFKVKILFLPPNTSHLVQPLDQSVNCYFKELLSTDFEYIEDETSHQKRMRLLRTGKSICSQALSERWDGKELDLFL